MGCARAEYPGVYARVAYPSAFEWIKETSCSMTTQSPCEFKYHSESEMNHTPTSTQSSQSQANAQELSTSSSTEYIEITPDGGCFLDGTELDQGQCALNELECKSCGGGWLKDFPSCYIPSYGYSSKIKWCTDGSANCEHCGGVFFRSPPTIKSAPGTRRKIRELFSKDKNEVET